MSKLFPLIMTIMTMMPGAEHAQDNADQDHAQHWRPLCQDGSVASHLVTPAIPYVRSVPLQH